jgi:hypothetical protein
MCKRRFYAFIKKKAEAGEMADIEQYGRHVEQLADRM